jgi:hypothetical protein
MWFMNHVARPIVALILRSPLHRLLSGRVMLVIYRGRRSGREIAVPVRYIEQGGEIGIRVGAPDRKQWWRNFETARPATLVVRGEEISATGRVTDGGDEVGVSFTPDA